MLYVFRARTALRRKENEAQWQTSSQCLDAWRKRAEDYLCSSAETKKWSVQRGINFDVSVSERIMRTSIKLCMPRQLFLQLKRKWKSFMRNNWIWFFDPWCLLNATQCSQRFSRFITFGEEKPPGTGIQVTYEELCESRGARRMRIVGHKNGNIINHLTQIASRMCCRLLRMWFQMDHNYCWFFYERQISERNQLSIDFVAVCCWDRFGAFEDKRGLENFSWKLEKNK